MENKFGKSLKSFMIEKSRSVPRFCNEHGLKYPTVANWISGKRRPSLDSLISLKKMGFEGAGSFLIGNDADKEMYFDEEAGDYLVRSKQIRQRSYITVPLIDQEASAGPGSIIHSDDIKDQFAFSYNWMMAKGIHNAKLSCITVSGQSMGETLRDGEVVLVNHDSLPVSGKIALISSKGMLKIKRLMFVRGGWIAMSDNKDMQHENFEIQESDLILGIAVASMKDL